VKFVFWLALHGRLWTAEHRMHHDLQQNTDCVLCAQDDKTIDHLFTSCVFTREV
jgi:fumarate reductase subunit D